MSEKLSVQVIVHHDTRQCYIKQRQIGRVQEGKIAERTKSSHFLPDRILAIVPRMRKPTGKVGHMYLNAIWLVYSKGFRDEVSKIFELVVKF
ncbi:hypothetical protein BpHYR1_009982 [Brachionus plicatilis]|uniref:Uncharacterized protein n=1 Tax=Brachionus plicatilis TaxID=10195 RepID=A0A3M7RG70_BRAPC|nr:hypothetical protein BpHYR1_009982 [Brachionus plicatilis]